MTGKSARRKAADKRAERHSAFPEVLRTHRYAGQTRPGLTAVHRRMQVQLSNSHQQQPDRS